MAGYYRGNKKTATEAPATWAALLNQAINEPGKLLEAYQAFHNYSFGNMCLAMFQAGERGLAPIATYNAWQDKGRQVRKGEKAIVLCQPIIYDKKDSDGNKSGEKGCFFTYKARWFFMHQTEPIEGWEGETEKVSTIPAWDETRALESLKITQEDFKHINGNIQGYARPHDRVIAINPMAQIPLKTMWHEIAHVILGHGQTDDAGHGVEIPRNIQEVEAESVAMLLMAIHGIDGIEYCRGYIQNWTQNGNPFDDKTAKRIFDAVQKINAAGTKVVEDAEEGSEEAA